MIIFAMTGSSAILYHFIGRFHALAKGLLGAPKAPRGVDPMRKIAMFMVLLMVMSAGTGWCLVERVDRAIEGVSNSDIRPVADTGRVLDLTNRGIDKGYHAVTDPMAPVLDPVRKVRDESIKSTKSIINVIWDAITFRSLREKPAAE